eukprot:s3732_g2.t1
MHPGCYDWKLQLKQLVQLKPLPGLAEVQRILGEALAWKSEPRLVTAVLSALAKVQRWDVATRVLQVMRSCTVETNVFHFSSAVAACEKGKAWHLAVDILEGMSEVGILPNEVTFNSAIGACEGSSWATAIHLLDGMHGVLSCSKTSCNVCMNACSRVWHVALSFLRSMAAYRVLPDVVSCSCAIHAGSPWDVAFHLLGQTASDPIAFTAALATRGPWVYALELFENLRFLRLRVDAVLCHHVAAACRETGSRVGSWQHAVHICHSMSDMALLKKCGHLQLFHRRLCGWRRLSPGSNASSADAEGSSSCQSIQLQQPLLLVFAHQKCAAWEKSMDLLAEISQVSIQANAITFAVKAGGSSPGSRSGSWTWALELLKRMCSLQLRRDSINWTIAAASCDQVSVSAWKSALRLCQGPGPATEICSAAITSCEKQSRWRHAVELLRLTEPDMISFGAAIAACANAVRQRSIFFWGRQRMAQS